MIAAMSTPNYGVTVSLAPATPIDAATVRTIARRIEDDLIAVRAVMTSHGLHDDDTPLASWTALTGPVQPDDLGGVIAAVHDIATAGVRAAGVAEVVVHELSATSDEELTRKGRTRERAQLVGVDEFREMLARDGADRIGRTRFWELMGLPEAPKAVARGKWTRHQAEAFAAAVASRPEAGRPRRPAAGE